MGTGTANAAATLTAQVAAAERFARAIVVAFGVCDEVRAPLSDVQKIAVIQAALLEFDGFEAKLASLATIGDLLRELHWKRGGELISPRCRERRSTRRPTPPSSAHHPKS